MTIDVLYISPHSDDVAFSASARLARDVRAGRRVAVLTLFDATGANVGSTARDEATRAFFDPRRRDEDQEFAACFGVELLRLDLPDFICRHPDADLRRVPDALSDAALSADAPWVAPIYARIEATLAAGVSELVGPLGVGHHVDHQLAFGATRAVARAHPELQVRFYEDIPYAFWRNQLALRLDETRVAPDDRVEGADVADTKVKAIHCYRTQWPQIYPTLELWREAFAGYAHAQHEALPFERTWRLGPPPATNSPLRHGRAERSS
jgi:LmbE family N-acetylglucosaminyl deacetylase